MIDLITVIAASVSIVRIITYRRRGSRYNWSASLLASLLMILSFCIIVHIVINREQATIALACLMVILAGLLIKFRGNTARLIEWQQE